MFFSASILCFLLYLAQIYTFEYKFTKNAILISFPLLTVVHCIVCLARDLEANIFIQTYLFPLGSLMNWIPSEMLFKSKNSIPKRILMNAKSRKNMEIKLTRKARTLMPYIFTLRLSFQHPVMKLLEKARSYLLHWQIGKNH